MLSKRHDANRIEVLQACTTTLNSHPNRFALHALEIVLKVVFSRSCSVCTSCFLFSVTSSTQRIGKLYTAVPSAAALVLNEQREINFGKQGTEESS